MDIVAIIVSITAAVFAGASVIVAVFARRDSKRSANAAERVAEIDVDRYAHEMANRRAQLTFEAHTFDDKNTWLNVTHGGGREAAIHYFRFMRGDVCIWSVEPRLDDDEPRLLRIRDRETAIIHIPIFGLAKQKPCDTVEAVGPDGADIWLFDRPTIDAVNNHIETLRRQ